MDYLDGKPTIYVKLQNSIVTKELNDQLQQINDQTTKVQLLTSAKNLSNGNDGDFANWLKQTSINACEAILKRLKGIS